MDQAPARAFDGLDLPDVLMDAVGRLGYTTPTKIQAAAIPALLSGRDVAGVARTGTGKTAAFGLPLVASIDPSVRAVQALVLTPTRELALQVAESLTSYAADMPGLEVVAVYGGAPFVPQKRALAGGAQIVVGTPGRIMDHLDRGTLRLDALHFAVLDEADEMLRMGFADDVERILETSPAHRQTALFSATMPPAIRRVATQHLRDPLDVTVGGETTTAASVTHEYAIVPFPQRAETLARTVETSDGDATIVFVRTKSACEDVARTLTRHNLRTAVLNGDVAQSDRERIVQRLRDGGVDVLVATDVAARGLDVDRLDLVVNFDAPQDTETYVHRIGRTGRAGRSGRAVTFFSPRERYMVRQIEKATGAELVQVTPPDPPQVFAHRTTRTLAGLAARAALPRVEDYRAALTAYAAEHDLDVTDLAAALLAHAAGDDGTWAPPPPASERREREHRQGPRTPRAPRPGGPHGPRKGAGTPYKLGVGRRHGARPASIVGAMTNAGNITGADIGRIDIREDHTIVEMVGELSEPARRRIASARIAGRKLFMEPDRGGPAPRRHTERRHERHER